MPLPTGITSIKRWSNLPTFRTISPHGEIRDSLKFLATTPTDAISDFRDAQLLSLKRLVPPSADTQTLWNSISPQSVREASAGIRTVALSHLMHQLGLGAIVGSNSPPTDLVFRARCPRKVFFRSIRMFPHPLPLDSVIADSQARFRTRSRPPGYLYQDSLWSEASDQVAKGWLGPLCLSTRTAVFLDSGIIPPTRPSDSQWSKWTRHGRAMTLNTDVSTPDAPLGRLLNCPRGAASGKCVWKSSIRMNIGRASMRTIQPPTRTYISPPKDAQ